MFASDNQQQQQTTTAKTSDNTIVSFEEPANGVVLNTDVMLCGVSSHAELEDIISSLRKSTPLDFTPYAIDDSLILNPSNWDDRIY